MRPSLLFVLASLLLPRAEAPRIVVVGGPSLLWPQIISEYQRRYPSQTAVWEVGLGTEPSQVDLVFAYYPTPEELKGSLSRSAKRCIAALTDRAQRMLALRSKPNGDKRVALIYYDNPAGKGNIGASYLQVFERLTRCSSRDRRICTARSTMMTPISMSGDYERR